jgi:hypothetical protein
MGFSAIRQVTQEVYEVKAGLDALYEECLEEKKRQAAEAARRRGSDGWPDLPLMFLPIIPTTLDFEGVHEFPFRGGAGSVGGMTQWLLYLATKGG